VAFEISYGLTGLGGFVLYYGFLDATTDSSFRHDRSVFVWLRDGFDGGGRWMGRESIAQVRLESRFKPDLHQYLLVGKNILAPKMAISQNALDEKHAGQIVPQIKDFHLEPSE
jgi:hypothetical protein